MQSLKWLVISDEVCCAVGLLSLQKTTHVLMNAAALKLFYTLFPSFRNPIFLSLYCTVSTDILL